MKKAMINVIANVTVAAVGIGVSALSGNENFNRRLEVLKKANKDFDRKRAAEKILSKHGDEVRKSFKISLLTGELKHGSELFISYADFFELRCAMYSLYGGEDARVIKGKYFNEEDKFRAHERIISNGKMFLFIASDEDKEMYDGGPERIMSYRRICESGKNIAGDVYCFDVKELEKSGYNVEEFGGSLVSCWSGEKKEETA